jgi:uncharacterized ion transporter superfamily protein YfcC
METNVLALVQFANIAILVLWPTLSIIALLKLRVKESFTDWVRIAWTLIIIVVPILGAISFLIATPANQTKQK